MIILVASVIAASTFLVAAPAQAANTTPSDIYFPITAASGSSCASAPGGKFTDSGGTTQLNSLIGAIGDQITVHNRCPANIFIYYGQATPYQALASGATATYTLTGSVVSVIAYGGETSIGGELASIALTEPPDVTASGSPTTLSPASVSTAVNSQFTVKNDTGVSLSVLDGTGSVSLSGPSACTPARGCSIGSGSTGFLRVIGQGTITIGGVTLTIGSGGGGGGGGGSSSAVTTPGPIFTLTITPPVGVTCRTSGESATAGSWVRLPAANDCTSPAATPNAQLLGWATNPDFPTAIAQRQITNGWGAYEIFDASGRITAVFIPAGGAILVSAPGSLFPIWRS